MSKSKKQQPSAHDRKLRQEAKKLNKQGWDVNAASKGFDRPKPIGKNKKIPDVVAKKAGAKRMIEVETPISVKSDNNQHKTFRRSAGQQKRTTFQIKTTNRNK